jgi:hypothetical protein
MAAAVRSRSPPVSVNCQTTTVEARISIRESSPKPGSRDRVSGQRRDRQHAHAHDVPPERDVLLPEATQKQSIPLYWRGHGAG